MKKWQLILYSDCTDRRYVESSHRWKVQALLAKRKHRLYRVPTWRLCVERADVQ